MPELLLYVWGWRNPRPERPIETIELSAGNKHRYILVSAARETQ